MDLEYLVTSCGTVGYGILAAGANVSIMYVLLKSRLMSFPRSYLEELAVTNSFVAMLHEFLSCGYCFGTWSLLAIWVLVLMTQNFPDNTTLRILGFVAATGLYYLMWAVLLSHHDGNT